MRKLLGLLIAATLSASYVPSSPPGLYYVAGGGTANAQTVTYSPVLATGLYNGLSVCWLPVAANTTTTPTLAVNGLTAKTITKLGATALVASDLTTTAVACAVYDGVEFQLQNPQTAVGGPPSGAAGGDLSGSYPNPTVAQVNGAPVPASATLLGSNSSRQLISNTTAYSQTIASGTATMGTSGIASGTCATAVTASAPGVATTDAIIVTVNADPTATTGYAPASTGSLYIWAYPMSGSVNFKGCNNTLLTVTPSAITLNWRVVR